MPSQVGCGAASYRKSGGEETLFTCNYGPPGNVMGGSLYQVGPIILINIIIVIIIINITLYHLGLILIIPGGPRLLLLSTRH